MGKVYIAIAMTAMILGGCAQPKPYVWNNPYDPVLTKALNDKVGNNTIKGNAFLRQAGGGIVTCAGYKVILFPNTLHSAEQASLSFDNLNEGYVGSYLASSVGYRLGNNNFKETACDGTGNFEFEKIGDGEYFIVTTVNWDVSGKYGPETQGGYLMKQVKVIGNELKKVVLSH